MVQAIDVPILEIPSIQKAMTIDELSSMWNVFSKCKNSIENGRRLENLSWRLWYRESSLQQHHQSSSVSTCSTFGPATLNDHDNNTTMDIQIINNESNNIVHLTENKEIIKEEIPYQLSNQQSRKSKFFVDNSDTEDDDDEVENSNDDDDDDDDMWSTFESNHEGKQYLEEAYQKKFTLSSLSTISTMTTATTLDEDEEDMESAIKSSLHYHHQCLSSSKPALHHQQQQRTSLLSKLFKQEQQQKVMNHHYDIPPELPPTLQSCVDWEKTQNMIIPCKLGQSPILPDENIIW